MLISVISVLINPLLEIYIFQHTRTEEYKVNGKRDFRELLDFSREKIQRWKTHSEFIRIIILVRMRM